jgi:hypothetical protein
MDHRRRIGFTVFQGIPDQVREQLLELESNAFKGR